MSRTPRLVPPRSGLDRRSLLKRAAVGVAAVPFLNACDGTSMVLTDAGATPDAGHDNASTVDAGAQDAGTFTGWAVGGTAGMTAKASYPDPFTAAATTCMVVSSTTEGPCTTEENLDREDVSEGWSGLPVRLALRVVDGSCNPLAGVVVKIWHTNLEGVYSGQTPNPGMCSGNDQSAIAADYFRGVQTTDAGGVVYFDTCFPGWYRGRAVHIHFQILEGGRSSQVSQLFFPEAITEEVFADHAEYQAFGQPDTVFSNDNVASGIADMTLHTLDVQRMTDGAMLASKTVAVVS